MGFSGKLKTAFTMVTIVVILVKLAVSGDFDWFGFAAGGVQKVTDIAIQALVWISAGLTVISGCVYLKGYWNLIDSDK